MVSIPENSKLFGMYMVLFNATMWALGAWIKKEERKICGFSEMLPCALCRIWRYLIGCVRSVWLVDCIFCISFKFWACWYDSVQLYVIIIILYIREGSSLSLFRDGTGFYGFWPSPYFEENSKVIVHGIVNFGSNSYDYKIIANAINPKLYVSTACIHSFRLIAVRPHPL